MYRAWFRFVLQPANRRQPPRDPLKYLIKVTESTNNPVPRIPPFIYANENRCRHRPGLRYLIYIYSSPQNHKRRDELRRNYPNPAVFRDGRTQFVFLLGVSKDDALNAMIDDEIRHHNDIVLADYVESYRNLTYKSVMALAWLTSYCTEADYAIKADDDVFVNIFELIKILEQHDANNRRRTITCHRFAKGASPVYRHKSSRWYVEPKDFIGITLYPQYCFGLSFAVSRDVVADLYQAMLRTNFFWIDDVYTTGLLTQKVANITYTNIFQRMGHNLQFALTQYRKASQSNVLIVVPAGDGKLLEAVWRAAVARLNATERLAINPDILPAAGNVTIDRSVARDVRKVKKNDTDNRSG